MKIGEGVVDLVTNLNPLKSGLRAGEGMVGRAVGAMGKMGRLPAMLGMAGGVAGIGLIGKKALSAAMDVEESNNLFKVSLGEMAAEVDKWAQETADKLTLDPDEIKKNVGTLNTMFSSLKMGNDDAKEMSKTMTELAYDMSSFYNIDAEAAFQKIQGGLTGEAEGLKRMGIVLNETAIKQFALTTGLIKEGEEMDSSMKVRARYGALLEQTTMAQGDLLRTQDSSTNALRGTKIVLGTMIKTLGKELLPVANMVFKGLKNFLKDNKDNFASWAKALGEGIGVAVDAFKIIWIEVSTFGKKFGAFMDYWKSNFLGGMEYMVKIGWAYWKGYAKAVIAILQSVGDYIIDLGKSVWDWATGDKFEMPEFNTDRMMKSINDAVAQAKAEMGEAVPDGLKKAYAEIDKEREEKLKALANKQKEVNKDVTDDELAKAQALAREKARMAAEANRGRMLSFVSSGMLSFGLNGGSAPSTDAPNDQGINQVLATEAVAQTSILTDISSRIFEMKDALIQQIKLGGL